MKHRFLSILFLCATAATAQNYIAPRGIQASIGSSQGALIRVGAPVWKGLGVGFNIYNRTIGGESSTLLYKPQTNASCEIFYSTRLRQSRFHLYSAVAYGYVNYTTDLRYFPNTLDEYSQRFPITVTGTSTNIAANCTYEIILPRDGVNRSFYTTILPIVGVAYNTAPVKGTINSGAGYYGDKGPFSTNLNTAYLNMGVGFRFIANGFHFGLVSEYHYNPDKIREVAVTLAVGGKVY